MYHIYVCTCIMVPLLHISISVHFPALARYSAHVQYMNVSCDLIEGREHIFVLYIIVRFNFLPCAFVCFIFFVFGTCHMSIFIFNNLL